MSEEKRLKVLFITAWYPTKEHPIEGIFVREHARAVRLYDDVVVLHCAGPDQGLSKLWRLELESDASLTQGIPTYRVWYRRSRLPKVSYLGYLLSSLWAFATVVKGGFRPNVIHGHIYQAGVPAVLIGRMFRIPVIISEHYSAFPRHLLSRRELLKARLAFTSADLVLPVSYALKNGIEHCGIRAKFEVVPNVVDVSLFHPPASRNSAHALKRILFVGLLDTTHIKGVPDLLQALARLREERNDWHLDIVGDGPARDEYERQVLELGLAGKVTFHGIKSKEDVAEFMRQADFFALPSLWDNLPCAAIEAVASGLPIVATCAGGIPEIVKDTEMGFLVPPGNVVELSKAMVRMIECLNEFDRCAIAEEARNRYGFESVGGLMHSIYAKYGGG